MDSQLRAQLRQTIYVAAPASANAFGDLSHGTPSAMSARIEFDDREMTDATTGEVLRTDTRIITAGEIKLESMIWLPGSNPSTHSEGRRPARVLCFVDERGEVDHYETFLGVR